jgi:hypothetical protein
MCKTIQLTGVSIFMIIAVVSTGQTLVKNSTVGLLPVTLTKVAPMSKADAVRTSCPTSDSRLPTQIPES